MHWLAKLQAGMAETNIKYQNLLFKCDSTSRTHSKSFGANPQTPHSDRRPSHQLHEWRRERLTHREHQHGCRQGHPRGQQKMTAQRTAEPACSQRCAAFLEV